ncbi:MAG: outer membrane protein assembly factor BamD [Chlorobiaceae bacterium]
MSLTRLFLCALLLVLFATDTFLLSGCSSTKPATTATTLINEGYAKAVKLYDKKDYSNAAITLESLIFTSRGTALEDKVLFLLGQAYYNSGQYLLALDIYSRLLQQIPSTPFATSTQFMLAKTNEKLSPHYKLDQHFTIKAIEQFAAYLDLFPVTDSLRISGEVKTYRELLKVNPDNPSYKENYNKALAQLSRLDSIQYASKAIPRLRDKLAKNEFSIAHQYVQLGKYKAATIFYDELIKHYSDTGYVHQSWNGKIDVLIKRKKWFDAAQAIEQYLQLYPAKEKEMAGVREKIMQNLKHI